jgi:hypothetical protein
MARFASPVVTDAGGTAPPPKALELATEPTLATATTSTTTPTLVLDDEDIVMDTITVRENEA